MTKRLEVQNAKMSTSPLSVDLCVSPMRPYNCPDQLGEGEVATDEVAAWAQGFGKKIRGIYITHGHSDQWLGLTTGRRASRGSSS